MRDKNKEGEEENKAKNVIRKLRIQALEGLELVLTPVKPKKYESHPLVIILLNCVNLYTYIHTYTHNTHVYVHTCMHTPPYSHMHIYLGAVQSNSEENSHLLFIKLNIKLSKETFAGSPKPLERNLPSVI